MKLFLINPCRPASGVIKTSNRFLVDGKSRDVSVNSLHKYRVRFLFVHKSYTHVLFFISIISMIRDFSEYVGRLKLYFLFYFLDSRAFVQGKRGFRLETIYYVFSFPFPTVQPHTCRWQGNRNGRPAFWSNYFFRFSCILTEYIRLLTRNKAYPVTRVQSVGLIDCVMRYIRRGELLNSARRIYVVVSYDAAVEKIY